jgi:SAM-dependent methyltransferase
VSEQNYLQIVHHYEDCLRQHGSGAQAVNWKNDSDAHTRYQVMLDVIRPRDPKETLSLLDFGCGLAGLRDYIADNGIPGIAYSGLDVSVEFSRAAKQRHPDTDILCLDALDSATSWPNYDYIVMNGVFTRRHNLSVEEMHDYMKKLTAVVFQHTQIGMAFNVMSEFVDWEGEGLFHPNFSDLGKMVSTNLSRHFIIRNDYRLFEATVYVYR